MSIIRRLLHFVSGVVQFTLYSALFFVLMVAAGYGVASEFFGGKETAAPDLSGLTLQEALTRLQPIHASLLLERLQPAVQAPEGRVISQYPPAGATIKAGTPIRVVVSKGQPLVAVPDLRGRNKIEAGIRLRKIGLNIGAVATIPREGVRGGSVLATDPPAGTGVLSGSQINVMLAAGAEARVAQMPNLIGLTRDEAAEVLKSYGMQLAEERAVDAPDAQVGHVHDQSPKPGERVDPAARVTIFYQPPRVELPVEHPQADQDSTSKSQEENGAPSREETKPAEEDQSTSNAAVIPDASGDASDGASQNGATPAGDAPSVPQVEVPAAEATPKATPEASSESGQDDAKKNDAPAVVLGSSGAATASPGQ